MTVSAVQAPVVAFADDPLGLVANTNPDAAPSPFLMGTGILDPRPAYTYAPGSQGSAIPGQSGAITTGVPTMMWSVCTDIIAVYAVPSTISAVNIAASQSPVAAALTLVSVTGAGITAGVSIVNAANKQTVTGLLAIDGPMAAVSFGQSGAFQAWNPATALSRAVRLTSGGNDSGITFNVRGYDLFGYPMSENITGANAGIATGKKTWKYIASITPSAAVAGTVSVGTADIYGFPIRADSFGLLDIVWANAVITANTGYTVPDATSPATFTTGDVRGTYATQSASNGTNALHIYISIPPANLITAVGQYGVSQV